MRKINDKWKRILSALLVCAMVVQLAQMPGVYAASVPDSENTVETAADTEETSDAYEETENAYSEEDLQNMQIETSEAEQEDMQEAEDAVVQADETESEVQINDNMSWTLNENTTVSGITIAENATLTVDTQGHSFVVNGDIKGEGAIVLTGKNIKVQNIALKSITLDGAEVDASETEDNQSLDNQITAEDEFVMKDSTIRNAAFVGYDENVTGDKVLEFQGNNELNTISLVGSKENGTANVAIKGSITSVSNTNFCCDYTLTYEYENQTVTPEAGWPVTYRVKYTGAMNDANAALIGWHNAGDGATENAGTFQAGNEIALPSYVVKGYSSTGWKVNGGSEATTTLSGKLSGNLTLTAEMQAASVTVSMDLGYTPDETTNSSRRNYLLLAEKDVQSGAEGTSDVSGASSLTIASMTDTGYVEVRQPKNTQNTAVDLKDLAVQASTKLVLGGNLTVSGTASIGAADTSADTNASNVKLTVQNEDGGSYELKFTGNRPVFDTNAANGTHTADSTNTVNHSDTANSYEQTGGKLTTASDFGSGALNVSLANVTANVSNLYAKDLTVTDGSVTASGSADSSSQETASGAAKGEVGSNPADSSAATNVVFSDTTIEAATMGALGTYDQTFTSVTSENSALTGTLVQDCYRIAYDTSGKNFATDSLNHVLRSSVIMNGSDNAAELTPTFDPANGVLADPTGTNTSDFACWYINAKAASTSASTSEGDSSESAVSTESAIRKAILASTESVPAGLSGRTTLSGDTIAQVIDSDVTVNADETKTLTVHAWINSTATMAIQEGRLFRTLSGEGTDVSVPSNSAWTAQFISTGTSISGRDYQVDFASSALPEGTNLTLTVPGDASHAGEYYYYTVPAGGKSSVKFSEFTVMGGTDKFQTKTYTDSIPENETFLLAADFANAKASAESGNTVTFKMLTSAEAPVTFDATLSYTLTQVTSGKVSVDPSNNTVTITMPENDNRLKGTNNKVFLKAVLKNAASQEKMPYNVKANWNGKEGTWISRDTVLFEVGNSTANAEASLSGSYAFSGLKNGSYSIIWSLVYGADAKDNIAGNVISNEATADYTESHTEPYLSVTSNEESRVISAGENKTVNFNYETTEAKVTAKVQKQEALGSFSDDSSIKVNVNDPVNNAGTASVMFASDTNAGTYRICFSINDQSTKDDVYFVFIVE